jgi:hypothetical protein
MCLEFEIWKKVLMKPDTTIKKESKKKPDIKEAVKNLGMVGGISGFIFGLSLIIRNILDSATSTIGTSLGITLMYMAILPIYLAIGWLVSSGFIYVYSLMIGGKGEYMKQSYVISIFYAPLTVIASALMFISITFSPIFPMIAPITGILLLLTMAYGLYMLTLTIKYTHKLTTLKSFLVWVVPLAFLIAGIYLIGSGMGYGSSGVVPMKGMFPFSSGSTL